MADPRLSRSLSLALLLATTLLAACDPRPGTPPTTPTPKTQAMTPSSPAELRASAVGTERSGRLVQHG